MFNCCVFQNDCKIKKLDLDLKFVAVYTGGVNKNVNNYDNADKKMP